MNLKEFKNRLEQERSKTFSDIVNERGVVNRDLIFALVIRLRGINEFMKMLDEVEKGTPDYTG